MFQFPCHLNKDHDTCFFMYINKIMTAKDFMGLGENTLQFQGIIGKEIEKILSSDT